jgi:hypothetical protein
MEKMITGEQLNGWLEPAMNKLKRAAERSDRLRLVLLTLANAAGCLTMLSPPIALVVTTVSAFSMAGNIRGPLDWFLVEVLAVAGLFFGYLSFQLYRLRPAAARGVTVGTQQAPELFAMLERRVSHFRVRPIDQIVLTSDAELKIKATPRWAVPGFYNYTLCAGAPLLFFISAEQLRLVLAGAISASAVTQKSLAGWLVQASQDWPVIIEALEERPSQLSRLLLKPIRRIAELSETLGGEFHSEWKQVPARWLLENSDEENTVDCIANQTVADAFLNQQYWPMIIKAADRSPVPVVKPFSHFELMLDKILDDNSAKRWLLQAQAGSNADQAGVRDLLSDLGFEQLNWSQIPEDNAFHGLFESADILKNLDEQWQKEIQPEWNRRYSAFQEEKTRFERLQKIAHDKHLRGASALRYVELAGKFLEQEQAISVYRQMFQANNTNATMCFATGRQMLLAGLIEEGCTALQRASELDSSLANRAHALINEHKRSHAKHRRAFFEAAKSA